MKNKINEKNRKDFIKNIIFLTFFIGVLLFSLSNINAANNTITDSDIGGIAQGIMDTGIGDTLFLTPGTYNKTGDHGININKSITIQGNGSKGTVIIDAQNQNRIFDIMNNNITFINLTFINGNSSGDGGVIYNNNFGNITFINCEFINNTALLYGGAICDYGSYNSTFTNCTFTNNSAQWGGAIFSWLRNGVTITNSTFTNNRAIGAGSGGAIYNEGDNYVILNSTFINNSATLGYGGAIINHGANFTLINSNFTNNTAYASGGAIYNHNKTSSSSGTYNFTVTNCDFTNNSARWGGAIYNLGRDSLIRNSNFADNTATNYGGAINNNGNLILRDSNFKNNNAETGGVIYNNINSNLSLSHNIMTDNSATLGQMIYNSGNIGILNLTYINNSTKNVINNTSVILYATLTDDMGNTVTGQIITFYVNGTIIGSLESIEGYTNITYTVIGKEGDLFSINGFYNGIGNFGIITNEGKLRVILIVTNSTIIVSNTTLGKNIIVRGVALDVDGNPLANVQLDIIIDSVVYNVITNSLGEWSITYTPNHVGNIDVQVSFVGNVSHYNFVNSTIFNVGKNSIDPKIDNGSDNESNIDSIDTPNDNHDTETLFSVQNENSQNNTFKASMKSTGIPILSILTILITVSLVIIRRKQI